MPVVRPGFGPGGGLSNGTTLRQASTIPCPLSTPLPLRALAGVTVPELWSPAYLSSAKSWLKGDELAGSDASAIAGWPDSSGSGNDPVIGIAPLLQVAELNGLNVVEFTAASSHFLHMPWAMISAWTEGSVFFVARIKTDPPASAPATGPIIGGFGNSGQTSLYPFTDSTVYDEFLTNSRKTVGNPGDLAAWHIGSFQSKASDWRYAFNGADFFTTATNTVGIPLDTDVGPYIGTNGGQFLDGYIAEIVFCNSFLTTTERQQVEGYLAWKWGLTAGLDAGHPYKSAAPIIIAPSPITGSSDVTFGSAATLTGSGALTGTTSLAFSPTATIKGIAPITGASTLAFSPSSTLTGAAVATGTSALTFAPTGTTTGKGALTGTTALILSPTGTTTGKGALTGTSPLSFATAGTIQGLAPVSATSSLTFAVASTITGKGALSGTASLIFGPAGTLTLGGSIGSLTGTSSISFAPSGTFTGKGALVGTSALTFSLTATSTGKGTLSGSSSIVFSPTSILTAAGITTRLTFTAAGNIVGFKPVTGSASFRLAASASLRPLLIGTASLRVTATGTIDGPDAWVDTAPDAPPFVNDNPQEATWTNTVPTEPTFDPIEPDETTWTESPASSGTWN